MNLLQEKTDQSQREVYEKLKKKQAEQIASIKSKYLHVLKQMRDDLVKSKKESWERLEMEWKKKKQIYDEMWMERVGEIRRHVQEEHFACTICTSQFKFT